MRPHLIHPSRNLSDTLSMKKIERLYRSHKRLDQLDPATDYREIINICINRLLPKSRILIDTVIYSTVLQSSVPPEDFPVLYRGGKGTFIRNTEKRMCDQNIIFSTFFNHENRDEYLEAISKMNYMHANYPEYINQRSLFRAGIKFAAFLGVIERTVMGDKTRFRLLGKYSDKFEASIHLLWSEIFEDMKIKGMPPSYAEMMDFIYDEETGPIHVDYIPAGNKEVRHYFETFEANFIKQNFSGWRRVFAPLGRRLLVLTLPKTTRISVGEASMKNEWFYSFMLKTILRVLSFRIVRLPSLNPVGQLFKDNYVAEYADKPKCPIEYVGQGTSDKATGYQQAKASGDMDLPWEGCPYHSDNDGVVGVYRDENTSS